MFGASCRLGPPAGSRMWPVEVFPAPPVTNGMVVRALWTRRREAVQDRRFRLS